mmetsp:Transcript_35253/g.97576  ORF Transcript_35253/g.97576 Transcript_35253/m.97576 type:complete len:242 (+) Transcript_35253:43-768(+)
MLRDAHPSDREVKGVGEGGREGLGVDGRREDCGLGAVLLDLEAGRLAGTHEEPQLHALRGGLREDDRRALGAKHVERRDRWGAGARHDDDEEGVGHKARAPRDAVACGVGLVRGGLVAVGRECDAVQVCRQVAPMGRPQHGVERKVVRARRGARAEAAVDVDDGGCRARAGGRGGGGDGGGGGGGEVEVEGGVGGGGVKVVGTDFAEARAEIVGEEGAGQHLGRDELRLDREGRRQRAQHR